MIHRHDPLEQLGTALVVLGVDQFVYPHDIEVPVAFVHGVGDAR